jgi:hypothetical protein
VEVEVEEVDLDEREPLLSFVDSVIFFANVSSRRNIELPCSLDMAEVDTGGEGQGRQSQPRGRRPQGNATRKEKMSRSTSE